MPSEDNSLRFLPSWDFAGCWAQPAPVLVRAKLLSEAPANVVEAAMRKHARTVFSSAQEESFMDQRVLVKHALNMCMGIETSLFKLDKPSMAFRVPSRPDLRIEATSHTTIERIMARFAAVGTHFSRLEFFTTSFPSYELVNPTELIFYDGLRSFLSLIRASVMSITDSFATDRNMGFWNVLQTIEPLGYFLESLAEICGCAITTDDTLPNAATLPPFSLNARLPSSGELLSRIYCMLVALENQCFPGNSREAVLREILVSLFKRVCGPLVDVLAALVGIQNAGCGAVEPGGGMFDEYLSPVASFLDVSLAMTQIQDPKIMPSFIHRELIDAALHSGFCLQLLQTFNPNHQLFVVENYRKMQLSIVVHSSEVALYRKSITEHVKSYWSELLNRESTLKERQESQIAERRSELLQMQRDRNERAFKPKPNPKLTSKKSNWRAQVETFLTQLADFRTQRELEELQESEALLHLEVLRRARVVEEEAALAREMEVEHEKRMKELEERAMLAEWALKRGELAELRRGVLLNDDVFLEVREEGGGEDVPEVVVLQEVSVDSHKEVFVNTHKEVTVGSEKEVSVDFHEDTSFEESFVSALDFVDESGGGAGGEEVESVDVGGASGLELADLLVASSTESEPSASSSESVEEQVGASVHARFRQISPAEGPGIQEEPETLELVPTHIPDETEAKILANMKGLAVKSVAVQATKTCSCHGIVEYLCPTPSLKLAGTITRLDPTSVVMDATSLDVILEMTLFKAVYSRCDVISQETLLVLIRDLKLKEELNLLGNAFFLNDAEFIDLVLAQSQPHHAQYWDSVRRFGSSGSVCGELAKPDSKLKLTRTPSPPSSTRHGARAPATVSLRYFAKPPFTYLLTPESLRKYESFFSLLVKVKLCLPALHGINASSFGQTARTNSNANSTKILITRFRMESIAFISSLLQYFHEVGVSPWHRFKTSLSAFETAQVSMPFKNGSRREEAVTGGGGSLYRISDLKSLKHAHVMMLDQIGWYLLLKREQKPIMDVLVQVLEGIRGVCGRIGEGGGGGEGVEEEVRRVREKVSIFVKVVRRMKDLDGGVGGSGRGGGFGGKDYASLEALLLFVNFNRFYADE
ncbi:Gamma-tubulin complex component 6 [Podochytrium sp. JEL0797]|nr:Gamma-tubulin complex component 6 [Podochytrium sp. JEL0797]